MSPVSTRFSFGLYTLLTRVIPGAILEAILYLLLISGTENSISLLESQNQLLIAVVIAFLFGEGIDLFRRLVHPVPYPFLWLLYIESGRAEFLPPHHRISREISILIEDWQSRLLAKKGTGRPIKKRVIRNIPDRLEIFLTDIVTSFEYVKKVVDSNLKSVIVTACIFISSLFPSKRRIPDYVASDIEKYFRLNLDTQSSREIFDVFIKSLEPRLTEDTRRSRRLAHSIVNSLLSIIFVILSALTIVGSQLIGYGAYSDLQFLISGLILIFAIPIAYFLPLLISTAERNYVLQLITEYYLVRIGERE